ncbi:GNAT family N-acetyltransferase [Corynebacterium doosanense]|uniref:GNAT family N-acetyltransferase n=1 Tax=Corynebacterium doosanense TaxID=1121358 RepID=UPI0012DF30E2|nr:GNAT family N-acetyltransferase [Corynebacterium doosanense]
MNLTFHPIVDPTALWPEISDDYEFRQHWLGESQLPQDHEWYMVRDRGEQAALLDLDLKGSRGYWRGAAYRLPLNGPDVIGIEFIDVRSTHRGLGIGTAVVHWVAEQYPQRQLLALAEASDGFWQSLGWELVASENEGTRPMYVSPL